MPQRLRKALWLLLSLFSTMLYSTSSIAHFNLNLNVRIIHVEHQSDGVNIYLRLPMPYLVAHLLGEAEEGDMPAPAPYTYNRMEEGRLVHYVDAEALQRSPDGLARLATNSLQLAVDGDSAQLEVVGIRLYPNGQQPGFATLEEAQQAMRGEQAIVAFEPGVYVGDTTVDILLRYNSDTAVASYALSSPLNPGLPDQDKTANLILDYRPGSVQVFRVQGLLDEPVVMSHSLYDSMMTFVGEGVKHILEGIDHVLFVICLVLGAMHLRPLLWRVTGFTVGHSITLSLGFFGFVPSAAWFVPAVETGIALSIIYVAVVAVLPDFFASFKSEKSEWTVVGITTVIGLLHGLGFSFVLQNILQVTSPNIWQSLLAFNVGVEVGQLLIVLVTLAIFYLVGKLGPKVTLISRFAIAAACAAISLLWVIERGNSIITNI
jgi:hypothetical protein